MKLKILKAFRAIWLSAFVILIVISIIGMFLGADSFLEGWQKVQYIFSPFNVVNYIVMLITLSPAILAHHWIEKLESGKQKNG
ncbi:MAG: hypothetical protein KDI13_10935 [Alphaproteobacteria bacterium]|nr:hypothetical protein [Alphaproteobacteria bacterium]